MEFTSRLAAAGCDRIAASQWINPAKTDDGAAAMARSFDLPGSPRDGWLRVIATGPYRVAINGWLVADDQIDLAAEAPDRPTERTFDVSAFLRSGANNVAIMVTTPGEAPRLRADLEATTTNGERSYIGSDQSWKSIAGTEANWEHPDFNDTAWQPCTPELGYLGVSPKVVEREMADIHPSIGFWLGRTFADFSLMVIFGLAAWLGCYAIGRLLPGGSNAVDELQSLPFIALLPSANGCHRWVCNLGSQLDWARRLSATVGIRASCSRRGAVVVTFVGCGVVAIKRRPNDGGPDRTQTPSSRDRGNCALLDSRIFRGTLAATP